MPRKKAEPFPLWLHRGSGQWAKKHNGHLTYFGTDREAALKRYVAEWDDIRAGRVPSRTDLDSLTVRDLVNAFLTAKRSRVDSGELSIMAWHEYHRTCNTIINSFGKNRHVATLRPDDFAKLRASEAMRLGAVSLGKVVTLTRSVFRWGYESELLEKPIRFGPDFSKPSKRSTRIQRAARGAKLLEPADLRKLIDSASKPMQAMLLLGINCGFGGTDCSELTRTVLAERRGWIVAVRHKNGVPRKCPLWPETIKALQAAHTVRPEAADEADDDCVFLTRTGQRFVRHSECVDAAGESRVVTRNSIGEAYKKLVKACGVQHPGGFYALRHTHRTIADRAKDQAAARLIMGHQDQGIDDTYRERIDDDRLEAVVALVHDWLYV